MPTPDPSVVERHGPAIPSTTTFVHNRGSQWLRRSNAQVVWASSPTPADLSRDLVETIRKSVTIDWTEREAVKADIRRKVKRLLRRRGYPPDRQKDAVVLVLQQAEQVCRDWGEAA